MAARGHNAVFMQFALLIVDSLRIASSSNNICIKIDIQLSDSTIIVHIRLMYRILIAGTISKSIGIIIELTCNHCLSPDITRRTIQKIYLRPVPGTD